VQNKLQTSSNIKISRKPIRTVLASVTLYAWPTISPFANSPSIAIPPCCNTYTHLEIYILFIGLCILIFILLCQIIILYYFHIHITYTVWVRKEYFHQIHQFVDKYSDSWNTWVRWIKTMSNNRQLTSTEQPIMDSRSTALVIMLKRFGGAFWVKSNISVTPPVKSSIASLLEPPFRFSYEPFILSKNDKSFSSMNSCALETRQFLGLLHVTGSAN